MPLVSRDPPTTVASGLLSLLGLAQLLGAPFWAVAFAMLAALAPSGRPRRTMIVVVALELVNAACAAVHWFVPRPPF